MPQGSSHRVVLVVDEQSNPFEVGCACEIFGGPLRPEIGYQLYDLRVAAPRRSTPMRDALFSIGAVGRLDEIDRADTVIVPNRPYVATPTRPALLAALRRAHRRGARLVGLCTGAFTLAEAGLLDGRRATVHWDLAEEFRARFPAVTLAPDVLFVDDGDVLTSAGSAAALDLGLHIVRRDYGAEVANHVSRRLVFAAYRDGGQRQFVERPMPPAAGQSLAPVLAWAQQRLDEPITVADLALRAGMSAGSLHRRFRAELGTTPLAWLTVERVTLACRLIEQGAHGLEAVARRSGLGTGANMRALFKRHVGVSPAHYRRRFTATP
ncbi:AraC family transcriptional regulator [Paractinoplanes deccanensis]|uniref:AraC family transcriptional regulator n=1 Tax=Paractinoplanes deccanensis TaxID=113561 RepID=A0ABQ3YB41_9ACTN|nr:helix-turn-helix domain-containing protein [Actinoplanes deccanensis]GID77225.1 AraC family transcriptional regulator [Actinoplanes deccanensis]